MKKLKEQIGAIIDMAGKLLQVFGKHTSGKICKWGYLSIIDNRGNEVLFYLVGDSGIEHTEMDAHHSRRAARDFFPISNIVFYKNSVRCLDGTVFSFNSSSEEINLAFSIALASMLGDEYMPLSLQKKIAEESKNDYIEHFCSAIDHFFPAVTIGDLWDEDGHVKKAKPCS